jgi:competence protein ComEA
MVTGVVKTYAAWLAVACVAIIITAIYLSQSAAPASKVQGLSIMAPTSSASATPQSSIKVDVSGAVNQPGVKLLQSGDRVEDALRAANGISDQADTAYVAMTINLAAKVKDGDKIFIPKVGQNDDTAVKDIATSKSTASSTTKLSTTPGKVSINQASATQLDTLPGVGATYASRIIAGRPYSSVDDLCSRNIFRSKSTCDKIKSLVTL